MKPRFFAVTAALLVSVNAAANPLLGTAGEFAEFCRQATKRVGSQEQIACMAFVGGVMQGHQQGAFSGLVYGIKGADPYNTKTYGTEGLSKVGNASGAGFVDGYCTNGKPSFTWGEATQLAVDYIDRTPAARKLGPAAMIMQALAVRYPCEYR